MIDYANPNTDPRTKVALQNDLRAVERKLYDAEKKIDDLDHTAYVLRETIVIMKYRIAEKSDRIIDLLLRIETVKANT